jgi:cytochrome bd-type quinol oxidase subunit 1
MNAYSRDILLKRWDTMKQLIGAVLVLTLILPVAPVLAGDTFRAFSRLPATVQASLTPMNEAQLDAIKGGQISQSNASTVLVTQTNTASAMGAGPITQSNTSTVTVTQSNIANVR